MDFGGIVLVLLMTPVLAAIGVTTLAAFALMTVLGLITDMSFKRLFFVSFCMGLAAPLLLAGAMFSAFQDGSFERDLRDGLDEVIALPEDQGGPPESVRALIPQLRDLRDDIEKGDLSEAEIERRIEGLFEDDEGVRVDIDGVRITEEGDGLRIQID